MHGLHCNTCSNDKPFDSYKNHKHYRRKLKKDNFTPCPGEDCKRCKQYNSSRSAGKFKFRLGGFSYSKPLSATDLTCCDYRPTMRPEAALYILWHNLGFKEHEQTHDDL